MKKDFFPEKLIKRRSELGYSQAKLAKKAGVKYIQISRYERGFSIPRTETIAKLAMALEVPFEWLTRADYELSENDLNNESEYLFLYRIASDEVKRCVLGALRGGVYAQLNPKASIDDVKKFISTLV